jgi:hypothetical protein
MATSPALMRRVYQVTGIVFLALGIYVAVEAGRMEYFTSIGPGAGFFPFWLGLLMAVLAVVWLGQVSFGAPVATPEGFLPDRTGVARIFAVLVALVAFTGLVDRLGYCLTMLAFSLGLLVGVGRQPLIVSLSFALTASLGIYYVFRYWLGVHLPPSTFEPLISLGF